MLNAPQLSVDLPLLVNVQLSVDLPLLVNVQLYVDLPLLVTHLVSFVLYVQLSVDLPLLVTHLVSVVLCVVCPVVCRFTASSHPFGIFKFFFLFFVQLIGTKILQSFTFYVDVFFPLSLPILLPNLTVYISNTAGRNFLPFAGT